MRLGAVVYARLDSKRLPNKAFLKFANRSLIEIVLRRSLGIGASQVVLATTDRETDTPLVSLAKDLGFEVVRGECDNVVQRTITVIEACGLDGFARINGDSPFADPALIASGFEHIRQGYDVATNLVSRTFPYGVAIECFSAPYYLRMASTARPEEKEHVTKHIYRDSAGGRLKNILHPEGNQSHWNLVVDTPKDAERISRIYKMIGADPVQADYRDAIAMMKRASLQ